MFYDYPENRDSTIGHLRRATVEKTDDSGTQQILKKLRGLASEHPEDVYRPQPHGLSSTPPAGSEGLLLSLGGRGDRMLALGFEHKDYRPKNTPEGGTVLYDHKGNAVSIVQNNINIKHASQIMLSVGGASITITDGKIVLKGTIKLGDDGGTLIGLCGAGCATKVYAV